MKTVVLITDLDNTAYDFVRMHATSFRTLLHIISKESFIPEEELKATCREVTRRYGSLDIQDLFFDLVLQQPALSSRGPVFMEKLLNSIRIGFDRTRRKHLTAYEGLANAFSTLDRGGVKIVALTNAPFVMAYRRVVQIGIRDSLSGIVAWEGIHLDDEHPMRELREAQRQKRKTQASRGFECFGLLEAKDLKPSLAGFERIREQYGRESAYFSIGDSIAKDLSPAKNLGATTIWAKYGTIIDKRNIDTLLDITPWTAKDIAAHVNADIDPDFVIDHPKQLLDIVPHARQGELF